MQNPFVSVVVCTYNRGKYLERCLCSLKQQSYQNYEIIVVNGPSNDETDSVLDKYPDVRVVKQETLNGLSYARNLGINASRGEIVAFIDDDAVADESWLNGLIEGYTDEMVGGVGGPVYDISGNWYQFKNGFISKSGIPSFVNENDLDFNDPDGDYLNYIMGTNSSFRRDVLFHVNLFDQEIRYYLDETDVCVRVIQAGFKIKNTDKAIVNHEMAEGHNRKNPYDINYHEISKNVMYFITKNFRNEIKSYTVRPFEAVVYWMRIVFNHYASHSISIRQLLNISTKIVWGAALGYKKGLTAKNLGNCEGEPNSVQNGKSTPDDVMQYTIDAKDRQGTEPMFTRKDLQVEKKMVIALISQEYAKDCHGGICRYTYDLAHGLAGLGNEVHVVTKSETSENYDYMDRGIFVHAVVPLPVDFLNLSLLMHVSKKNLSYSYAVCLKLLELRELHGIQVVEAPLWDAEGFVFSLIKPIPLVIRIETPLFKVADIQGWKITKDLKLANWMEGETVRRADKVIAISEAIGTLISDHHNVPKEKIVVSPLGIDLPDEPPTVNDSDKYTLNVLFVGRLEKRKGIETLLEAIPSVIDKVPNASFTIVGGDTNASPLGGSYKNYLLRNLDKRYHPYVTFTGFIPDTELRKYYENCDLFVAPSLYESFGLIYLEAMAWGKPVIGCNVGGVPEVIEDGISGIIVHPEDANELSEAIIRLSECHIRKEFGVHARQRVERHFSLKSMAGETFSIYRKVIQNAD